MSLQRVAFSPLHTFTRATDETFFNRVVDSFGNVSYELQTALSGTAVQNAYDPSTGEPLGLQVFEQRTNLFTYSEQFDDASWEKTDAGTGSAPIVTANAGVAPDGTTTADRIQFALNGGTAPADRSDITSQVVSIPSLATTSRTIWLKSNTGDSYDLIFGTTSAPSFLQKITVTPQWQRFNLVQTSSGSSSNLRFGLRNASGVTGVSDSADILVWGAQLEVGAFPTPYIKTEATTATRNASVAVINDIDESEWWNPSEGTFVVDAVFPLFVTGAAPAAISVNDNSTLNRLMLFQTNEGISLRSRAGGVNTIVLLPSGSVVTGRNKVAFAYTSGTLKASCDGGAVSSGSGVVPSDLFSQINLGASLAGTNSLNGNIAKIQYYPTAVSDAKLQELSTL